jgi:sugar/nucleoside kinase (ribokinase family)
MSLLVTGSIALDTIETPRGERAADLLGGSAVYFSYAAALSVPVRLVGVVGEGFPQAHLDDLTGRGVDCSGVRRIEGVPTFRWVGRYREDLKERDTLRVDLEIFDHFRPNLPGGWRESPVVFLANLRPAHQRMVLDEMRSPRLVVCDTMGLWIAQEREDLVSLLKRVDGLVINDEELVQLTEDSSLVRAGKELLSWGLKFVVVKKGEHGSLIFTDREVIPVPAYPLEEVRDPTGAGDSFAGGMMGKLHGAASVEWSAGQAGRKLLRSAVVYGTVCASFCVSTFGVKGLRDATVDAVRERVGRFEELLS